jgi:putative transposase
MVRIIREADKKPVADVAKKHGISDQTIYLWRRRFGTMSADDAKRLKALELENGKLKRMLAERLLDIEVLKDIHSKKW